MTCVAINKWARVVQVGNPTAKAVLCALADYADADGECFPSVDALAEHTEFSARAVQKALALLVGRGLITRVRRNRANGSQTTDLITLHVGGFGSASQARGEPDASAQNRGERRAPQGVNEDHQGGEAGAPLTTFEHPLNTQEEHSEANASALAVPAAPVVVEVVEAELVEAAEPAALSPVDRLWTEGASTLMGLGVPDAKARKMIGLWLSQTGRDAPRVLWAINEALRAGSGDPIPYCQRLLRSPQGQPAGLRIGGTIRDPNVEMLLRIRAQKHRRAQASQDVSDEPADLLDFSSARRRG